jgi:hypothetical protein
MRVELVERFTAALSSLTRDTFGPRLDSIVEDIMVDNPQISWNGVKQLRCVL